MPAGTFIKPTVYLAIAGMLLISCSGNKPAKQNTTVTEQNTKATEPDAATGNPDSLEGKNVYINPVDSTTYKTNGKFESYTPAGGVRTESGPVTLAGTVLLTEQSKFERAIGLKKLANFIKGIDTIFIKELAGVKERGRIIVQFTLYPDKEPGIGISHNEHIKSSDMDNVYEKIRRFSLATRTQNDSCMFQSIYDVNEPKK